MLEFLLGLLLIGAIALFAWNLHLAARLEEVERQLAARLPPPAAAAGPREIPQAPAAQAPPADPPSLASLFEDLIGGRLLIWVGGVALVVAAVFLIRFTIEIGLITPQLRMIAAGLFGLALLAGGEGMKISGWLSDDPRISQALVGAGLAVLYATIYGSYILYGFLGLQAASGLMLAITAAALALSLRHGIGAAAMGMIGGYLTPALVGDPDAGAPPLLAYLALLDAAVFAIAWRRGWGWLAGVAVLASFAWTASLLFGPAADALAAGWFILLLGIVAGVVRPAGAALPWLQPFVLAALQLAILTSRTDTDGLPWLLFAAVAAASVAMARARGHGPWVPLAILGLGLLLLPVEQAAGEGYWLPAATTGLILLFGGGGLALALERGSARWALLACAGLAGPAIALRLVAPDLLAASAWGLLVALLAAGPAILVWARTRGGGGDRMDFLAIAPAFTAAGLLAFAASDLVPFDGLSIAWLVLAIGFIALGMTLGERTLRLAGLALLTLTVLKLFVIDAAALDGLLRILSFFGLGASLIVLGRFYGTLLRGEGAAPAVSEAGAGA